MAKIRKWRGKWGIDYLDQFGRRHWETVGDRKQAKMVLAERELEVGKGTYRDPRTAPTFEEISRQYLQNSVKPNLRPQTARQYRGHIENHLNPVLGKIKIVDVNTVTVQAFITESLEKNSRKLTNKLLITLGAILRYAVIHRYIDRNPKREVGNVRDRGEYSEEEFEPQFLTEEEIQLLCDKAEAKYRPILETAVLTGMRQGELLGLQWGDIDWHSKQICVKRTLYRGEFYKPKTKYSIRKIDMAPELVLTLKKWKLECPISKLDLVFPNGNGNPENHGNLLRRGFYPALRKAGIRKIRFHDLRHTFASLLIKLGAHPKYIQVQMGHSSSRITMDIYGHLMESTNQKMATKLGAMVFGDKSEQAESTPKAALRAKHATNLQQNVDFLDSEVKACSVTC